MGTTSPFGVLVELLKASKLSDDSGYLCAELPQQRRINDDEIYAILEKCGYIKPANSITKGILYIMQNFSQMEQW